MKIEISNENKAKFFALYWGQKVASFNGSINIWEYGKYLGCDYLSLKPLSQISREDGKYAYLPAVYPTAICVLNNDYLRSKGYAVSWMGLSVEEMVKAGWIKLRKEATNV